MTEAEKQQKKKELIREIINAIREPEKKTSPIVYT